MNRRIDDVKTVLKTRLNVEDFIFSSFSWEMSGKFVNLTLKLDIFQFAASSVSLLPSTEKKERGKWQERLGTAKKWEIQAKNIRKMKHVMWNYAKFKKKWCFLWWHFQILSWRSPWARRARPQCRKRSISGMTWSTLQRLKLTIFFNRNMWNSILHSMKPFKTELEF